jgi:urea transport system permease protein
MSRAAFHSPIPMLVRLIRCVLALLALAGSLPAAALTPEQIGKLASSDSDARGEALNSIAAAGDESAIPFLTALSEGNVQTSASTKLIVVMADGKGSDAITGKPVVKLPEDLDEVVANNVFRREIAAAIATLRLTSTDRAVRLAAAKTLQDETESDRLPPVERAIAKEADAEIKALLERVRANLQLNSKDKAVRLAAITSLGSSVNPGSKTILLEMLAKKDGQFVEQDADIRFAAQKSLNEVEGRLTKGERIGQVFSGVSLGSILLLAALGLAITYGLMGVINMAHGELIMIGAYTTYVVQNLVRANSPDLFNWYLLAAVPASFLVAAVVGMALERGVIRFLYGRPLETLLATWGISLILIQAVRTIFGAQNVQVENPVWMSGGVELLSNVVLPWSRIVIIGFSAVVLLLVWVLLTRTRLGLFVRGVTQNRAMASCMGVHTGRVDTWCFGLGSGIAGLAGCALSQIGNVGPDLGQGYIVDSFMVVVLGGVGQLAGTVYAAMGLGIVNKFLEGISGAVLAKITVLVFIIIFIQKRPQGLFALKGRFADA